MTDTINWTEYDSDSECKDGENKTIVWYEKLNE